MPKKPVTVAEDVEAKPRKSKVAKPAKTAKVEKPTKSAKSDKSAKTKKSSKPAKGGKREINTPPKGAVNVFAPVVRALRKKLGKTIREFAEDSGFKHGPAIARLENDEYFGTSVGTMLRIADAVGGELVIKINLGK